MLLKKISLIYFFLLSFCCSLFGYTTDNWMSEVDDNRTLNEIILPGSHDAGMGTIYSCGWPATEANARTQTLSIGEQLNAGARYFGASLYIFPHTLGNQ